MGQNMSMEEKVYVCTTKGDLENLRKLKNHGAGLEWRDQKGRTPLMYACNHAELYETVKTLLELGAEKNAYRPREGGGTPLHHAARQGQERIAGLLLANNANPFVMNDDQETAHDIARRSGYVGVVRAIEQKIALFAAPMREQTGDAPGFLKNFVSQFIFTNVYVVVIPHRPDLNKAPSFILLVYLNDKVASPKYRVFVEYAQLHVKKPDTPETVLEVTDTNTKSKFKLLEAPDEPGQVKRLFNACKGLVPVGAPTSTPAPARAPFPPIPASYTPQGASTSHPPAPGTPSTGHSGQGKIPDSEDEALQMAIAASLETAKLEPGADASHDRYGGWADHQSSNYGGWGGTVRPAAATGPKTPTAVGPAAGTAAAYVPGPVPSHAPTGPKPSVANLPGAAASALPAIPGRQPKPPGGNNYGGWAVVEDGPGGWGERNAAPSAPPASAAGVNYDYRPGGSAQGHQPGASYDHRPSAGGSSTPGAGYAVVGDTTPATSSSGGASYSHQPAGQTGHSHGATYDYHPQGGAPGGTGRISYPSIDQSALAPVEYPTISPEDLRKPNLGGAGASSLKKAGEPQCAVCMDQPAEAVCIPCGHVAGCMECLTEIKAKGMGCPICRTPIKDVVKIFLPN